MNHDRHSPSANRGFTLIELMVVISVLGILAGLTLVAMSRARESARRLDCMNRLKQIGIALHAFQGAHSSFPPPMPPRILEHGTLWANPTTLSGYYELLPHLELASVYNSINIVQVTTIDLSPTSPSNATVFRARFAQFVCPSDSGSGQYSNGPNSFRFNVGSSDPVDPQQQHYDPKRAGAFNLLVPVSPSEFRDGLSTTLGMSERLLGSKANRFDRRRDYWCAGVYPTFPMADDDATLHVCRSMSGQPVDFISDLGSSWMLGGAPYLWYNHVAPPNDRASDCATSAINTGMPSYCETCSISGRSDHSGGVNCLMMDGSARFMRDGVALPIWRALGSRSGGDAANIP